MNRYGMNGILMAAFFWTSATVSAVPQDEYAVDIETVDQSRIKGTLRLSSVKIKGDLGDIEIELSKVASIALGGDLDTITTVSGSTVRGRLQQAEWKVMTDLGEFTLTREKLRSVRFEREAASPTKPGKPKRNVPADNELKPAAILRFHAALPELLLSKDRSSLYLLNTSEGKVQRVDAAKRTLDSAAAEVTDGTEGMCLTPDGKTLYTFASPNGHEYYSGDTKSHLGKIHVIDPSSLRIKSTFSIEFDPCDMVANDRGTLFVAGGSDQWTAVAVVDVGEKSVVAQWSGIYMGAILRMTPDQKRLYYGTTRLSPGDFHCIPIPSDLRGQASEYDSPYHGDYPLGGEFEITPDGAYLIAETGSILRLAKNRQDDMKLAAQIEPHVASAMDADCKILLVASPDGALKVYSYPEFELRKSYSLGVWVERMVLDAKSAALYCSVSAQKARDEFTRSGVCDLHVYDVGGLIGTATKGD